MTFLDAIPFDSETVTRKNWVDYVSCILNTCATDGLSDSERSAVSAWLENHDAPDDVLEDAIKVVRDFKLQSSVNKQAAKMIGPYLIRDAIRMSMVDGLSTQELASIKELANALGFDDKTVEHIKSIIERHDSALAEWVELTK